MGTYLRCKARSEHKIDEINEMWNTENPGYENTFHLCTHDDMEVWLQNIHTDETLTHLRYIKTVKQLNDVFSSWGLGTFDVKITLGDYLCSEMARRYIRWFDKWADEYFEENPLDDNYVRGILEEAAQTDHKAESCMVECPYCRDV